MWQPWSEIGSLVWKDRTDGTPHMRPTVTKDLGLDDVHTLSPTCTMHGNPYTSGYKQAQDAKNAMQ